jgi:hypothetical protein
VRYQNILEEFISELHPEELHNGCFQQDGATAHTAQMPLNYFDLTPLNYDVKAVSNNDCTFYKIVINKFNYFS